MEEQLTIDQATVAGVRRAIVVMPPRLCACGGVFSSDLNEAVRVRQEGGHQVFGSLAQWPPETPVADGETVLLPCSRTSECRLARDLVVRFSSQPGDRSKTT